MPDCFIPLYFLIKELQGGKMMNQSEEVCPVGQRKGQRWEMAAAERLENQTVIRDRSGVREVKTEWQ